ncbi:MAG: hypothetical protein RSC41_05320 [Oscillospiraceae bacterium]
MNEQTESIPKAKKLLSSGKRILERVCAINIGFATSIDCFWGKGLPWR